MIKKFIFDNYYDAVGKSSNNVLFTQILDMIKVNEDSINCNDRWPQLPTDYDHIFPAPDELTYDDLRFRIEVVDKKGKSEQQCVEDCKNAVLESYNSNGNQLVINMQEDLFDIRWK